MPLLNYTTKIQVQKTVGEVVDILTGHGAWAILQEYDDKGAITGLSFKIQVGEQELAFRLPADWAAVLRVMQRDSRVSMRLSTPEQARRVAWRILKDWVEAQMALIEVKLATMEQVFLPYALTPTGQTVYERLRDQRFALPPAAMPPRAATAT